MMKHKDYTVPLVLILSACLASILFIFFLHALVNEIETIGLKAIFEQIWCGKDGCND